MCGIRSTGISVSKVLALLILLQLTLQAFLIPHHKGYETLQLHQGDWLIYRVSYQIGDSNCTLKLKITLLKASQNLVEYVLEYREVYGSFQLCKDLLSRVNSTRIVSTGIPDAIGSSIFFASPKYNGTYIVNGTVLRYYNGVLIYASNTTTLRLGACCTMAMYFNVELVSTNNEVLSRFVNPYSITYKPTYTFLNKGFSSHVVMIIIAAFILVIALFIAVMIRRKAF